MPTERTLFRCGQLFGVVIYRTAWHHFVRPFVNRNKHVTKLATRKKEIEALEGFSIQIFDGFGKPADLNLQGLPAYPYTKKAAGTTTVVAWKGSRFQQAYPGYTCDVLHKDGSVAHGNTQLNKVR